MVKESREGESITTKERSIAEKNGSAFDRKEPLIDKSGVFPSQILIR